MHRRGRRARRDEEERGDEGPFKSRKVGVEPGSPVKIIYGLHRFSVKNFLTLLFFVSACSASSAVQTLLFLPSQPPLRVADRAGLSHEHLLGGGDGSAGLDVEAELGQGHLERR